jgi:hypothetical protein
MVEVTLSKHGGFGGYIDIIQSLDSSEEITIQGLCRCIGVIIIWERKKIYPKEEFISQYATTSFHIPPYIGKAKGARSSFFRLINNFKQVFEPKMLYYCGGKIDTPTNKVFYKRSKQLFLLPLKKLFPEMETYGMTPTTDQAYSNMHMNEFLEITFEKFVYNSVPESI